jgi:lambda family phage portal protein
MTSLVDVSWFDRLVLAVAPSYGVKRLRARATTRLLTSGNGIARRHFDAAAGGRRAHGWHRRSSDANAANSASLVALRELSRDLRRNNGWARRAIQAIGNNVVGWGIEAKPIGVPDALAATVGDVWREWSATPACDFDGRLNFAGLQRLVLDTVVESGEALILRETGDSTTDGLRVPLRVRVLEPDYLDSTRDVLQGDAGPIRQGIEFDDNGRRVAYHLFDRHPGATDGALGAVTSRRIPAAEVIHVYTVERPEQVRGVPWLAAAIAKLNDFDDYDDAVLMQQKIASCFAAFVQDFDGTASPIGELVEDTETGDDLEELQPGHIAHLPPGKSIAFASPPAVSDHGTFTSTNLRRIAATLGVTYEDLTGDYSQVNFSSARLARLAHWQNVESWRWQMLIPQFCDGVFGWFAERAQASEGWPEQPRAEWSPPPMQMIEPDKEGLAYTRLIRSGVMTLSQAIRERGEDPTAHFAAIAADNAELDRLGIVLDSDARKTTGAGMIQQDDEGDDASAAEGDDASAAAA